MICDKCLHADVCGEEGSFEEALTYCADFLGWISVSNELPKKNGWYSCTVDLSDFYYVTMDLYFKDGKWLDNRRINMFDCYEVYGFGKSTEKHKLDYSELLEDFDWTERVMAWMPLPEPYRKESEEQWN